MCQCASPTISANGRPHPSVMSGEFGKGLRHVPLRVEVTLAITRDDLQTRYIGREILCWVDILSYISPLSTYIRSEGIPALELRATDEFPHQGPIASLSSEPRSEITAQRPLPSVVEGRDAPAPGKGNRDYCATSIVLAAGTLHAIEKVLSSTIGIHGNLYSRWRKTAKSTGHRRPYRRQQVKEYGYRLRFNAVVS